MDFTGARDFMFPILFPSKCLWRTEMLNTEMNLQVPVAVKKLCVCV